MKRGLLLLPILILALTAGASERSKSEILRIAASALRGGGHTTRGGDTQLQVYRQTDMISVVGTNDQFVLIANDDAFTPVIGYGEGQPSLDDSQGAGWFIQAATTSMQAKLNSGHVMHTPIAADTERFKPAVEPLLTSTWAQDSPFNDLCPKAASGGDYPSGCVATALSQIMYYHKYPERGKGNKQYSFKPADGVGELLSANFEETTYDWEHMIDNYVKGKYSDEEGLAVATLLLHCGVSVEMNYTPSGSGAYSSEARSGLINNFRYHPNIGILYRDYYSIEEWMNIIFNELSKSRPIYYAGADKNQGGHAFVLDGYDTEGLVHVNWGWGANGGNGYFDITLLNPRGYEFSLQQDMLIGIARPEEDIKYESHLVSGYPLSVGKIGQMLNVSAGTSIWNLNGDGWSGEIGVVMKGKEKTYVLQSKAVALTANRYNVLSKIDGTLGGLIRLPSDIEDGEYRLYIGSKDERDSDWRLVRRSDNYVNSYVVSISDGSITLKSDTADTWAETTTGIAPLTMSQDSPNNIYDLSGRRLASPDGLRKGIYIIGGRKVAK